MLDKRRVLGGNRLQCDSIHACRRATAQETGRAPLEVAFDASASTDDAADCGDIVSYDWDFGDLETGTGAQTTHTYADAGTYMAVLTVADATGHVGTAERVITVTPPGGRQKPMDFNQDGSFDLSDPVALLNYLYLGGRAPPCENSSTSDPANITLLDVNGSKQTDMSDAIYALSWLFLGGARPVNCADDTCPCFLIVDCPDNAKCP